MVFFLVGNFSRPLPQIFENQKKSQITFESPYLAWALWEPIRDGAIWPPARKCLKLVVVKHGRGSKHHTVPSNFMATSRKSNLRRHFLPKYYRILLATRLRQNWHNFSPDHENTTIFSGHETCMIKLWYICPKIPGLRAIYPFTPHAFSVHGMELEIFEILATS